MKAHWRLQPHDTRAIQSLSAIAALPPLLAHLLINRGITDPAQARSFLDAKRTSLHDPALMPGITEAADRIVAAVKSDQKIVIYGDYDVDGVCGTAILWACLKLAGAKNLDYYIPHRVDEGYGVNAEALKQLVTTEGAQLVITVDCGITAIAEAALARQLGIDLIITDHHTFLPQLPEAAILVHPRLPGSRYPYQELCGAGVAFKLAWQICKSFGDGKKASPHLRDYLVRAMNLVALATVADVVPLADENRVFVRHGLNGLSADPSAGLRALLEVSGCHDKPRLNSGMIGFSIAPRINAAGRMQKARAAVEMLTCDDLEHARDLARHLDECNVLRQDIERKIVDEAHKLIEPSHGKTHPHGIVLSAQGWHAGVIGIVAGRLAEFYHRPTIILATDGDISQGSARSVPGFDLYQAIHDCRDGLIAFGGHKAAAGLRLPTSLIPEFRTRFETYCNENLSDDLRKKEILIDAQVRLGQLEFHVVRAIENLEPYGLGNPRPVLLAEQLKVVAPPRVVGERKNHLQLRLEQGGVVRKAIAWNQAKYADQLPPGAFCSVVFSPSINEWNGRSEVQLEIKDIRVEGDEAPTPASETLAATS